jgi:hypothetical protein
VFHPIVDLYQKKNRTHLTMTTSFYVVLRPKKQAVVDESGEEVGNIGSLQDKTTTAATEKVISDNPEVQEGRLQIIQRATL